ATESRGISTACTRRVQAQLETEVGPHARLHLLGSPERHPHEVDFHLLDAWQCHHFVLGVGHKLRTRWARRRSQCHIDFDRRSIDGNAVDEPEIHDVELQIGVFDAAECELHLIFRDDASSRGRFGCGKSWRRFFAHGGCRIIAKITRNKKGRRWRPFSIGNKAYFFFFLLEVLFFALERLFEVALAIVWCFDEPCRLLEARGGGGFQPTSRSARKARDPEASRGPSRTDMTAASERSERTSEITLAGRSARAACT